MLLELILDGRATILTTVSGNRRSAIVFELFGPSSPARRRYDRADAGTFSAACPAAAEPTAVATRQNFAATY